MDQRTVVIGTPDRRLERYLPLEQHLEGRLRPSQFLRALRGEKIDVRIEGARSYPEAVAHLRARRWDVLLGFSPVVSMPANMASRAMTVGMPESMPFLRINFSWGKKECFFKDPKVPFDA